MNKNEGMNINERLGLIIRPFCHSVSTGGITQRGEWMDEWNDTLTD